MRGRKISFVCLSVYVIIQGSCSTSAAILMLTWHLLKCICGSIEVIIPVLDCLSCLCICDWYAASIDDVEMLKTACVCSSLVRFHQSLPCETPALVSPVARRLWFVFQPTCNFGQVAQSKIQTQIRTCMGRRPQSRNSSPSTCDLARTSRQRPDRAETTTATSTYLQYRSAES